LSALENLILDLTSTLAALGMDFHLRGSSTMRAGDGWSGRA
jgi:hypothetical protein